ncbi:MAG: xylulose kinase [Polyangiaceae bacterium]|nr:xylulose kinase [Polyangiaceae bacterium]
MTPLFVGVDAGTSAVKAIAWTQDGRVAAEGRAALALDNPAPGAWEQDAESYVDALAAACRALGSEVDLARVRGVAIACQRETIVLTDDRGAPVAPAITWMDDRCAEEVREVEAELDGARLHAVTGKPPCTTPSLYKLRFLLRRLRPELAARAPRVLDVHGFLAWRLTGARRTSLAAADPTGLVDLTERRYHPPALRAAGVELAQLSELVEPGALLGHLTDEAAARTGLPVGTPLFAGAGDGQAAGLGAGVDGPGRAYLNLGTALVGGVISESPRVSRAYRTLFAASPGRYFLETDLKGGMFTVTWLAERLFPGRLDLDALIEAAARLPPGAEGLVVLPYWGGVMNPHWDDAARGAIVGWRGHHTAAHLLRATLEGLAFEQRLAFDGIERDAGPLAEIVLLGGGAKSALLRQIAADVLGAPLVCAESPESTSLGAAVLAAVGAGAHASHACAVRAMCRTGDAVAPSADAPAYARLLREVFAKLYPALRDPLRRLSELT